MTAGMRVPAKKSLGDLLADPGGAEAGRGGRGSENPARHGIPDVSVVI